MSKSELIQNFNWNVTERKLVVFIPCYHNQDLVEFSIKQMRTVMEPQGWCVIIGNDGHHIDWSYLKVPNVYYFSLLHDKPQPRNGSFIRNYALKRCKSQWFLQKDGEVCIEGDFAMSAVASEPYLWRAGQIYVLNKEDSQQYMKEPNLSKTNPVIYKRIEPSRAIDPVVLRDYLVAMNGMVNFTSFFHYAYCAPTQLLQEMQGYDEEFKFYGYEDSDMFCRLAAKDKHFKPDYNIFAVHIWHPSTVNKEQLMPMGQLFARKDPNVTTRNDDDWGEGG